MRSLLNVMLLLAATSALLAQDAPDVAPEEQHIDQEKLYNDFEQLLKKSSMVGTFTVDMDKEQKRIDERYDISKVVKQDKGDYWNFHARIRYGKHDLMLPIPVEVKWAGTTPVITVDNLPIPGMGIFDARVLVSDNKYAGTWRHGKVGGLMFGHIEKQEPAELEEELETTDPPGE